jgi:hypothetical protein
MGSVPHRPVVAIAAAFACVVAIGAASAQQRPRLALSASHDGVYIVDISTQQGICDKVYHWTITVAEGQIRSPADGFMQASGQITPRGVVALTFKRDTQIAHVAGTIQDKFGSGTWSSPTLQCAGSWTALRQFDSRLRAAVQ